jgi:hypothetical protein
MKNGANFKFLGNINKVWAAVTPDYKKVIESSNDLKKLHQKTSGKDVVFINVKNLKVNFSSNTNEI